MKKGVDGVIQKNGNFVSLTTDARSNVKNEPMVNYMSVNPENSLFVEAVNTEEQGHDANWNAQDLEMVMELLQCNISGAITDNTSANKKSMEDPQGEVHKPIFPWLCLPWVPFIGQRYILSKQDCTSQRVWESSIISR